MVAKEKFFHRDIESKIMQFAHRNEIVVIRGPRQAGKTTLMKLIAEKMHGKKVFVDLDILSNRNSIA
ncbi:MAG: AAA family ATPase, partial [Candidatus Micrarchaeia archaeon]